MANNKFNKISIKPMNNAAAIASTLGISANNLISDEQTKRKDRDEQVDGEVEPLILQTPNPKPSGTSKSGNGNIKTANEKSTVTKKEKSIDSRTVALKRTITAASNSPANLQPMEMPLMIEIKRRFPGKELFVLSLLYLQRNNRGLVQMTVGSMMGLYTSVFQDVIKDDTVRRSLKRLFDAGFIKTMSIPGNNAGYVYQIGDLLEAENLSDEEKEEFAALTEFVQSKLNVALPE